MWEQVHQTGENGVAKYAEPSRESTKTPECIVVDLLNVQKCWNIPWAQQLCVQSCEACLFRLSLSSQNRSKCFRDSVCHGHDQYGHRDHRGAGSQSHFVSITQHTVSHLITRVLREGYTSMCVHRKARARRRASAETDMYLNAWAEKHQNEW